MALAPKGEMEQGVVEKEPEHKQKNQISPATPSQNPSWPEQTMESLILDIRALKSRMLSVITLSFCH